MLTVAQIWHILETILSLTYICESEYIFDTIKKWQDQHFQIVPKYFFSENWYGLEGSFEDEGDDVFASNSTSQDAEMTAHEYNVDEWDGVATTEKEWLAPPEKSTFTAEAEENGDSVVGVFDITKGDVEPDRQANNTWGDWWKGKKGDERTSGVQ